MKRYSSPYEYLDQNVNLDNGYYEYYIAGQHLNLYTCFDNQEPWLKVIDIDHESDSHINSSAVDGVKVSDDVINSLITKNHEYSIMAVADKFTSTYNEWLTYPHRIYVHNTIERWASDVLAIDIPNSNLLSLNTHSKPIAIASDNQSLSFGSCRLGDTFFCYGRKGQPGLAQAFTGPGSGSIWIR